MPSAVTEPRHWRTREDPFHEHWSEIETLLVATPSLEAKTVVEVLHDRYPDRCDEGQLRTLQRRIRRWRAQRGGEREIVLAQRPPRGET